MGQNASRPGGAPCLRVEVSEKPCGGARGVSCQMRRVCSPDPLGGPPLLAGRVAVGPAASVASGAARLLGESPRAAPADHGVAQADPLAEDEATQERLTLSGMEETIT